MEDMMVKEQHHHEAEYSAAAAAAAAAAGQWVDVAEYHSPHTHSPSHEYAGYSFVPTIQHGLPPHPASVTADPSYNRPLTAAAYANPMPAHHSIFPTGAQWPSMLTNPSSNAPSPISAAPPALAPVSAFAAAQALPPLTTPAPPPPTTARRTLTDQDRRRMCQYHEDNPTVKQTEIGVLRQKDKYLFPDDSSRSPIKRSKGKFPDIERALSNWVRNHQKQGLPLSDNIIREKARFFATTVGSSESHAKVNSTNWLEKFKQKNRLLGAKARKDSEASEADSNAQAGGVHSGADTPNGLSPISPDGVTSVSPLSPTASRDNLKASSPDSYMRFSSTYKHGHSQSATSLASGFTDTTAPTSFSPHSPTSPLFTSSDVNSCGSPYPNPTPQQQPSGQKQQQQQHRVASNAAAANTARTRSQTYPALGIEADLEAPMPGHNQIGQALTQKQVQDFMSAPVIETPVEEYPPERNLSLTASELTSSSQLHSVTETKSSPNLVAAASRSSPFSATNPTTLSSTNGTQGPSQDEARRALELVMDFFQSQPSGVVDPQEYIMMGKLMEKLKVQGPMGQLPGGMHSIDIGSQEVSRKRSIQSL